MSRETWRPHIEDALVLNLSDLRRGGLFAPEKPAAGKLTWRDGSGRKLFAATFSALLEGSSAILSLSHLCIDSQTGEARTAEYIIRLDTTRPHLGGTRWWFRCPCTGKRAAKLYLFPGMKRFCCRTAILPTPTYAIQRVSGLRKAMQRRWALRTRIGADDTLFTLTKPKGLHRKTFAKYERRDMELEAEELRIARRRFGANQLF